MGAAIVKLLSIRRQPIVHGDVNIRNAHLTAPVKVVRDKHGIPHIYGETVEDVVFGQGFCHAQERLWQMEIVKRIANGLTKYISC
jgi:penicillin amidase